MTLAIGHNEVEQFRALVSDRLGLCFDDARLGLLADALRRHIDASGVAGETYLKRLVAGHSPPEEWRTFAQELTVTETYFYRSADQIRAFVELALPQCLATRAAAAQVRVLSAGCASGDEPYSLAIAIREQAPDVSGSVALFGADVNPAMLEKARRAVYTGWSLRELPAPLRTRWFRGEAGGFTLDAAICRAVSFEERNLVQATCDLWQPASWDIVFCRNVLMYFEPALAQAIVARMARSLVPGGYLFLGHAETLRGLSNDFHLCHTHGTFYYRLKEGAPEATAVEPVAPARRWNGTPLPRIDDDTSWVEIVRGAAERIHALADVSRELSALPVPATPRLPDLHSVLEQLGSERFDRALEQLGALPPEQANEPEALLLRAVSAAHSGALAQAEQTCRSLIERDELSAGAHYVLALCREGLGDVAGAIEQDQIAVYLDPGFAMARLHLGLLARRRGEKATARRELAQALVSLQQEDASRLLLFGGGFNRQALIALCQAELSACGEHA